MVTLNETGTYQGGAQASISVDGRPAHSIKGERPVRKTQRLSRLSPQTVPGEFRNGEKFKILGREYVLHIYYYGSRKVEWYLNGCSLNLYLHEGYLKKPAEERALVKRMVESFLRGRAEIEVEESVKRLSSLTGLIPQKLTVKKMIRDWGRCSPLGNITINQEVVAHEKKVIDYVVLRELLHLKYDDDETEFQKLFQRFYPQDETPPSHA